MISFIIVVLALLTGLASALRRGGSYDLITHTPYNNRYSDAPAARDERSLSL